MVVGGIISFLLVMYAKLFEVARYDYIMAHAYIPFVACSILSVFWFFASIILFIISYLRSGPN
jgi:hypothetical protein